MKDFEPFRKLWITTSDWVRWHESWLSDPLSAINAEELERCVNDSWKTMQKSVRYFSAIPGSTISHVLLFVIRHMLSYLSSVGVIDKGEVSMVHSPH